MDFIERRELFATTTVLGALLFGAFLTRLLRPFARRGRVWRFGVHAWAWGAATWLALHVLAITGPQEPTRGRTRWGVDTVRRPLQPAEILASASTVGLAVALGFVRLPLPTSAPARRRRRRSPPQRQSSL